MRLHVLIILSAASAAAQPRRSIKPITASPTA